MIEGREFMRDMRDMRELHALPKAPRRFQVLSEDTWIGSPSVPYGIIRRLAHEERKSQFIAAHGATYYSHEPYLRVLFGEAGRRGDPWGGLALEVNGEYFHFTSAVRRFRYLYENGDLTERGRLVIAHSMHSRLATACDWRWVQDEVDCTSLLTGGEIDHIAGNFRSLRDGHIPLPKFQSRIWAMRLQVAIKPDHHNCTTIIMEYLRRASLDVGEEEMPLPVFDALSRLVAAKPRSQLDDELNYFLSLKEWEVDALLFKMTRRGWNDFAKSQTPVGPPQSAVSWQSLLELVK